MNKNIKFLVATAGMICSMAITTLAGQWIEYDDKWFYMTDDGNFAKNTWLWLDENHDNNAELYHFEANGVMSQGTAVTITDGSYETLSVNFDANGVATDCIHTYSSSPYHSIIEPSPLPSNYAINVTSDGSYTYSSDIDHYDFKEINEAWIYSINNNEENYSAEVYLLVYHGGSDPGLFGNFECSVKTTAKFAKNCEVKPYPDSASSISIESFAKKKQYYNYLIVDSVDSNGYITNCTIMGVE